MEEYVRSECPCCSAPIDPSAAVRGVLTCKYCGNILTIPKETSNKEALSYLRQGELLLDTGRFSDAWSAFFKASEIDASEPEAYFGMARARFGVRYLRDETADPPCIRPITEIFSEERFSEDKDFRRALETATFEQADEYRRKAGEIDRIHDEFLRLKKAGVSYDCFLCVKVTSESGMTTQDSHEALKLYHFLQREGYRPFYSEVETGERAGVDYEALILYALYSSDCMVVVCSNEEYLRTKWVSNEYKRFLHLIADEEKERDAVTIAYLGKPVERLPGREGKLQGVDLSRPDAYTKILAFVERHTPAARERRGKAREEALSEAERRERELSELRMKLERLEEERAEAKKEEEDHFFDDLTPEERARLERKEAERRLREGIERKIRSAVEFTIVGGVLKRYKGRGGEVVIPPDVTEIGEDAFRGNVKVTSVMIPSSVKEISAHAFSRCENLTRVAFGEGLTVIGKEAFAECIRLTAAPLPDTIREIGVKAFSRCDRLEDVRLPDGLYRVEDRAFSECKRLSGVLVPEVTHMGKNIFRGGGEELTLFCKPAARPKKWKRGWCKRGCVKKYAVVWNYRG